MKIYHTATQYDYETLMIELEEKGYLWLSGDKPTSKDYWSEDKENSCVRISGEDITSGSLDCYKEEYPNENIIEYRAKGENMEEEEMKHKLQEVAKLYEVAFDISASIESFARGALATEADLQEAKSSAKKLIEKIDEYFETLKPKFKVGDYVVEQNGDVISKIEEVINGRFFGSYYKRFENYFYSCSIFPNNIERYATPKEIAEYEVALTFHKRGRKPFEVKEGDLIEYPNGQNIMIYYPECFSKADFLNDGFKLIKTAEEVSEWLKGE